MSRKNMQRVEDMSRKSMQELKI